MAMKVTTQLKNLLRSGRTEFILEAHNGLPRPDVSPRAVKQRLMRQLAVDRPWLGC